jgi:hypothetical protein
MATGSTIVGRLTYADRLSPRSTILRILISFLENYPVHNRFSVVEDIYCVARSLLQEFDEGVKIRSDAEEPGEEEYDTELNEFLLSLGDVNDETK